ncbi:hypothetical protein [Tenggerimyces flavus]|uniref:Uncharacterized protein n=1 Tax=Tenggerimyces flavus TaxID=1708749 RepID=A0ABV7YQJ0_9ACTN|nr:hypothetical protein [Tenggerimyces flavus]MBM7790446.1 hypothetical protein [Tenggerimyces flavus]
MSKRTGIIVAAVITGVASVVAGIVGAKTDNFHVVVGPLPDRTVTVTTTVTAPPLPAPTVTVTVPGDAPLVDEVTDPGIGSMMLADLRGSGGEFGTGVVKIDGVTYPDTVHTALSPCGAGDLDRSTWTWEGDVARLVGRIGLTDESFTDGLAYLAVYEGNGASKLLKRFPATTDGLTDVDVPLDGIYTMTIVAEADNSTKPGCSDVTLAFLDAKLERPDSG